MKQPCLLAAALSAIVTVPTNAQTLTPVEITAPGPEGRLAGTLIDSNPKAPLVLIIPGSGPTDRDGNNRLGVKGAPYRQLADALGERGIATLRVDKRGMFGSQGALADPFAVTISGYADDVHAWADVAMKRTGRHCIWVLGHSEGALVALVAAQNPKGLCGVILIAGAGRPLGAVLREQLTSNPANAPILASGLAAIESLEAGRRVDPAALPAPLQPLFGVKVQPYLIDLLAHDPAKLIASIRLPILILQGDRDLQVSVADAEALKRAQPHATLELLAGINHVLRPVPTDDRAANFATYGNAALPIAPVVAQDVAGFVSSKR